MFTVKSIFTAVAAASLAAQATAFSSPPCWSSCFQKYNVSSEASLCTPPLSTSVAGCITSTCSAANSTANGTSYNIWLGKYCAKNTSAPVTLPITTSTSAVQSVSTPAVAPTGNAPAPYSNATLTASYTKPAPSGTASSSTSSATSTGTTVAPYTGAAAPRTGVAAGAVVLLGGALGFLL